MYDKYQQSQQKVGQEFYEWSIPMFFINYYHKRGKIQTKTEKQIEFISYIENFIDYAGQWIQTKKGGKWLDDFLFLSDGQKQNLTNNNEIGQGEGKISEMKQNNKELYKKSECVEKFLCSLQLPKMHQYLVNILIFFLKIEQQEGINVSKIVQKIQKNYFQFRLECIFYSLPDFFAENQGIRSLLKVILRKNKLFRKLFVNFGQKEKKSLLQKISEQCQFNHHLRDIEAQEYFCFNKKQSFSEKKNIYDNKSSSILNNAGIQKFSLNTNKEGESFQEHNKNMRNSFEKNYDKFQSTQESQCKFQQAFRKSALNIKKQNVSNQNTPFCSTQQSCADRREHFKEAIRRKKEKKADVKTKQIKTTRLYSFKGKFKGKSQKFQAQNIVNNQSNYCLSASLNPSQIHFEKKQKKFQVQVEQQMDILCEESM